METEETSPTWKRYTIMKLGNITLIQNKILWILVFCNSVYFWCMYIYFFAFFLPCAHPILFGMKVCSIGFSVLFFFFFCTSLVFCYFLLFYFHIMFKLILNHTKFLQLNLNHSSDYIGMRFQLYIFLTMFCVCFPNCAYLISKCCFSTLLKNWKIGLVDYMTAMVPHQSYMTQRPSLFTLISYCAIAFSFAPMFTNGWFS